MAGVERSKGSKQVLSQGQAKKLHPIGLQRQELYFRQNAV